MKARLGWCWLLIGLASILPGCGQSNQAPRALRYEFKDGGPYRVDCTYETEKHLAKFHAGKIFSETREGVYVKSSYRMEANQLPDADWLITYTLVRLRIHDREGNFKLEIGPESGEVQWYQDKQTLGDYLGAEDFRKYQKLVRLPLARIRIHPEGIQVPNGLEFNFDLLRLLGKNRIFGEYLTRGVKVPPVLMTTFKREPVAVGAQWDYQGNTGNAQTRFHLKALSAHKARIDYASDLELTASELQTVKRALRLDEVRGLELKQSRMRIRGGVDFSLTGGRPDSADMGFEKQYEMALPGEVWKLRENEKYQLSVNR
jgi:hypothetical protein